MEDVAGCVIYLLLLPREMWWTSDNMYAVEVDRSCVSSKSFTTKRCITSITWEMITGKVPTLPLFP